MKYKYNIRYKKSGKVAVMNFKNKRTMLAYLNKNTSKVNSWPAACLNFGMIALPLKQTVWGNT